MRFDIVIVGGGVLGWSTAWHLIKAQPKLSIAVCDGNLTNSSALRGAGGLRAQHADPLLIRLSQISLDRFAKFPNEVGEPLGLNQSGYLMMATENEMATRLEEAGKLQREMGVRVAPISLAEMRSRFPGLIVDDMIYAQLGQDDCLASAAKHVVRGYCAASLKLGVQHIASNVEQFSGNAVHLRSRAEVFADTFILTPGVNAQRVAAIFGIQIDVRPEHHQLRRWQWKGVQPDWPMVVEMPSTLHFRPYGHGVMVGYDHPQIRHRNSSTISMPKFDERWMEPVINGLQNRMPAIIEQGKAGMTFSGWYGVTPDGMPYLDRVGNVVVACGLGGHGVMHSPAIGMIARDLALQGTTDLITLARTKIGARQPVREGLGL